MSSIRLLNTLETFKNMCSSIDNTNYELILNIIQNNSRDDIQRSIYRWSKRGGCDNECSVCILSYYNIKSHGCGRILQLSSWFWNYGTFDILLEIKDLFNE